MNKQKVVSKLIENVKFLRRCGSSDPEIKRELIAQGWAFGAVDEAFRGA